MDKNGCGVMAVYNSEKSFGMSPEVVNSIDEYLKRIARGKNSANGETLPYVPVSLLCISNKRR